MSTELTNTSKLREFVEELKKLKIKIVNLQLINLFLISRLSIKNFSMG